MKTTTTSPDLSYQFLIGGVILTQSQFSTASCYVAFLDVLGFKELVESNSFEFLMRLYENAFLLPLQLALANGAFTVEDTPAGKRAVPDLSKANVECLIISDSVILWNTDGKMTSFVDLCAVVGKFIAGAMMSGVPLRGSISTGDLAVYNASAQRSSSYFGIHSVVGKPLIRAYNEEQAHEWAGCTIDDECIDIYDKFYAKYADAESEIASKDYLSEKGLIARYEAPHKTEDSRERWVVDWPRLYAQVIDSATLRKGFEMHGKHTTDASVQRKIANTIDFLEFSNKRGNRKPH